MKKISIEKQSITCDIRVEALQYWKGKDFYLPPNTIYTLTIDYPFNKPGYYLIRTGSNGMGLIGLLPFIGKYYLIKYQAVDQALEQDEDDDDGYWHGIEDLVLEGIDVDHKKKTIKLDVGS